MIKPVYNGFNRLIYSDLTQFERTILFLNDVNVKKLEKEIDTLNQIQELNENVFIKLYLISLKDKTTFDRIKARFCEIFPKVEDIIIEPLRNSYEDMPFFLKDNPYIQIKEKGVDKWIAQDNISSGMFKALINICELYLCADGTIFLIDEFENSLGVNCIDEITNEVLNSYRNLQFIITSHHPYIINNIPYTNWKLVTRNAGKVKAQKVDKFNIGKSNHDAFMQLMQLEEFLTGSE